MSQTIAVRIVFNHIPRVTQATVQRAKAAVAKASKNVETTAKVSMTGPKGGLMYGSHQASAPGEPPASDSGNLANSIGVTFEDEGLTGLIGPSAEYGIFLEFGTTKMAARPFMTPAAEKEREPFIAAMRKIVEV